MHHCLQITEVLTVIAKHVQGSRNDNASIASMARTCQVFSEVALDILWAEQESLVPLIYTLPSSLLEERVATGPTGCAMMLLLRRPMVSSDWSRFSIYAPRIKILKLGLSFKGIRYQLEEVVSRFYMEPYRDKSLLPNLRCFTIDIPNNDILPHIHLFCGAELSNLSISFTEDHPKDGLEALLTALRERSPSILFFVLGDVYQRIMDGPSLSIFSNFICSLDKLQSLSFIPELPSHVWIRLASSPIAALNISLPSGQQDHPSLSTYLPQKSFLSLTALNISMDDMNSWLDFTSFSPTPLQMINLSLTFTPSPAELKSCFLSLESFASTLTMFMLNATQGMNLRGPQSQSDAHISNEAFVPLLTLHRLQILALVVDVIVRIDDSLLHDMARAWPRMTNLDFSSVRVEEGQPQATLAGLLPFAKNCVHLKSLGLTIDSGPVPESSVSQNSLRRLVLGRGLRGLEGSIVAPFLSSVFPNATVVYQ
ncbi:hypothetical protein JAAARDRAFT_211219 [Jaapia argillacea MUCL 33604]|uniref:F-box domain-containing protein n=1 Tax=Jaapia argillacea MUCL 33604 TaxID=933084 RepID=A0A067PBN7_9AGAM|nr:hypothetical protein JAAARDRAFT_211219 [Jaapia argillacea MUCL 33604]